MKKIIVLSLLLSSLYARAQITSKITNDFASSVPSLDMFLCRFNGTQHNPYASENFLESELRKADIALLFDYNFLSQSDKNKQLAMDFAEYSASNDIMLSLLDSLFFIEVECPVEYKGKKSSISLTIQAKATSATTYKWVIVDVRGDMLEMAAKDPHCIIMPHEHSLNFMKMVSMLERYPETITSLVPDDCILNTLTTLCALVSNKLLTFKPIANDGITFHFLQVPEYVFSAKRLLHEGSNSGWLITNLEQCSNEQKQAYINRLMPHVPSNDTSEAMQRTEMEMLRAKQKVHEYYDMLNRYLALCSIRDSSNTLPDEKQRIVTFFDSPNQEILNDLPINYYLEIESSDSVSIANYTDELVKLAEISNVSIAVSVNEVIPINDPLLNGESYMVKLYKMISVDGDVTCHDEILIYHANKEKLSFYVDK